MSTILEALRELEGTPAPGTQDPPVPWTDGSRRRVVLAGAAAFVLVAGAIGLVLALRPTPARVPPGPSVAPPVPAPAAAPSSPKVAATAPAERPWGHVQSKSAAAAPDPAPAERAPARVAGARAAARPVPPPAPPEAAAQAPAAAPPDPGVTHIIGVPTAGPSRAAASPAPRPLGAPHVRITGLAYADNRGERVAALAVDGGTPVTLHEGEAADGIEVQLILPDRVYVRSGSNVFAVDAR